MAISQNDINRERLCKAATWLLSQESHAANTDPRVLAVALRAQHLGGDVASYTCRGSLKVCVIVEAEVQGGLLQDPASNWRPSVELGRGIDAGHVTPYGTKQTNRSVSMWSMR